MIKESVERILFKQEHWPQWLMILGAVFIIALLFPDASETRSLGIGESWDQAELVADRDFDVAKDSDYLKAELKLMRKNFIPIFSKDISIARSAELTIKANIKSEIDAGRITDFTTNSQNALLQCVAKAYDRGIFNPNEIQDYKDKIRIPSGKKYDQSRTSDLIPVDKLSQTLSKNCPAAKALSSEQFGNLVASVLKPNLIYNKESSDVDLEEVLKTISVNEFSFKTGDVLIRPGQEITEREQRIISAFNQNPNERWIASFSFVHFIGYLLLTLMIFGALTFYVIYHFPELFEDKLKLLFLLVWPVIFSLLVFAVELNPGLSSYVIPFSIVPIIVKNFLNDRLALFMHVVIILIASFLSSLGYEFTFIQMLGGIVSILFFTKNFTLNSFFYTILILLGTYLFGYLGLSFIQIDQFADFNWRPFLALGFSAFLTLLAFPMMPLLEQAFKFTSSISLNELSDLNKPLLRRLATEAPGTLQHSLQVSNLARAAAEEIGANELLVKTAALYHDIGKLIGPEFFIENQSGVNPHEMLSNFESAEKIIGHSIEGVKMAQKAKLPQVIIDFIATHHGDTRVEYFYRNQLKLDPEHNFDEAIFRYPGPKPSTREQSILMIADSLEAASKSLKNPTGQDIDTLVDKIIAGKIDNGQLDDTELSFKELEQCSAVFKSLLRSINHVRIEYPDEVKPK